MLESDSSFDLPDMEPPKRKKKQAPFILKKPKTVPKITFEVVTDDEEPGPSMTQQPKEITADEVSKKFPVFTESYHVPLMLESIRKGVDANRSLYAQVCLPGLVGQTQKGGTGLYKYWEEGWGDIFFLVNFYHGYNPVHLFGAQLAVTEFVYSAIHDGRIHIENLEECIENILFYFLSVRSAIFSGLLLPSPGTSLIRTKRVSHVRDYSCCLTVYKRPKKDKSSVVLEHILKHFTHEPRKSELVKFTNPWLGLPLTK